MDRERLFGFDRSRLVNGLADHIHDAAEGLRPNGHADHVAGVGDVLAAGESLGGVHRNTADRVLAEVGGDLQHEVVLAVADAGVGQAERGQQLRQFAGRELYVHHRSHHLYDSSVLCHLFRSPRFASSRLFDRCWRCSSGRRRGR